MSAALIQSVVSLPGFMQFISGIYLFAGLTLFGTFKTPALYMAAPGAGFSISVQGSGSCTSYLPRH